MRNILLLLVGFALAILATGLLLPDRAVKRGSPHPIVQQSAKLDLLPGFAPSPSSSPDIAKHYAVAWQLLTAGRLPDAQDEYLKILLTYTPNDRKAMQGLIAVRRLMAQGDTALLQQQADMYRRAIAEGKDTGEHYTPRAMAMLAEASLQAAKEIVAEQVLSLRALNSRGATGPLAAQGNASWQAVPFIKTKILEVASSLGLVQEPPTVEPSRVPTGEPAQPPQEQSLIIAVVSPETSEVQPATTRPAGSVLGPLSTLSFPNADLPSTIKEPNEPREQSNDAAGMTQAPSDGRGGAVGVAGQPGGTNGTNGNGSKGHAARDSAGSRGSDQGSGREVVDNRTGTVGTSTGTGTKSSTGTGSTGTGTKSGTGTVGTSTGTGTKSSTGTGSTGTGTKSGTGTVGTSTGTTAGTSTGTKSSTSTGSTSTGTKSGTGTGGSGTGSGGSKDGSGTAGGGVDRDGKGNR